MNDRKEREFIRLVVGLAIIAALFVGMVTYGAFATPHMTVGPINVDEPGAPAEQQ